jgi:hypothetical protein
MRLGLILALSSNGWETWDKPLPFEAQVSLSVKQGSSTFVKTVYNQEMSMEVGGIAVLKTILF